MIKHLIRLSGGAASWACAKRVVQRHGTDGVFMLFADTLMEDEDLYRFLSEATRNIGVPLFRCCDGRTPWEVFFDERYLGNSRVDPCSKILKRQLMDRWTAEHCDKSEVTIHFGISWDEAERFYGVPGNPKRLGLKKRMAAAGWSCEAPLCEKPWITKEQCLDWMRSEGIEPPRLYGMGFSHNNCGGFCIKAGISHFENLLRVMPERYRFHEQKEQDIRAVLGDVSILSDRRGGTKKPLTLRRLRERVEATGPTLFEYGEEWGGCGCAIDDQEQT